MRTSPSDLSDRSAPCAAYVGRSKNGWPSCVSSNDREKAMGLPEAGVPTAESIDWSELDAVIARFEQSCWEGRWPTIDDYLPTAGSELERRILLREFVHIDLELRSRTGQVVSSSEYL